MEATRVNKFKIFASISVLSLTFGVCTIGFADDKHGDKHGDNGRPQGNSRHEDRVRPQDNGRHEEHGQPQRGRDDYRQAERRDDRGHSDNGRHLGQYKHMERADQDHDWQHRRASHWESEHRDWHARGGYRGYRIPDDYFRVHYGNGHYFHVYGLPFAYEGSYPRFQYAGHWLTIMDPYPEYWGPTWYQNDDVYVDYRGDGYYLFNRRYPGRPGLAINISF
jgi:hypothetical protein